MRLQLTGILSRLGRSFRPMALAVSALLLVAAVACGATQESQPSPQSAPAPSGEASQELPSQPSAKVEGDTPMTEQAATADMSDSGPEIPAPSQPGAAVADQEAPQQAAAVPQDVGGTSDAKEPAPMAKAVPEQAPMTDSADTPAPAAAESLPDVGNEVGNRIPDITLDLVGGATVSSVSLIEEGQPTFLFFTSTT